MKIWRLEGNSTTVLKYWIPFSPHPHQHLLSHVFFIIAILTSVGLRHTRRSVEQNKSPEITHIYGQLIYEKAVKIGEPHATE